MSGNLEDETGSDHDNAHHMIYDGDLNDETRQQLAGARRRARGQREISRSAAAGPPSRFQHTAGSPRSRGSNTQARTRRPSARSSARRATSPGYARDAARGTPRGQETRRAAGRRRRPLRHAWSRVSDGHETTSFSICESRSVASAWPKLGVASFSFLIFHLGAGLAHDDVTDFSIAAILSGERQCVRIQHKIRRIVRFVRMLQKHTFNSFILLRRVFKPRMKFAMRACYTQNYVSYVDVSDVVHWR